MQTHHKGTGPTDSPRIEPGVTLPNEVVKEIRIVTTAVDKAGGEIVQLSPTRYMSPELAAALDDFKKLATGTCLRPEGLTFHSTQSPPSEETIRELMETITLDREWESQYNRNFFRAAHDAQPIWGDAKRLYHAHGLKSAFPTGEVLWVGTNPEFEVCCPLLPADIPEVGLAPLGIVRWKPGHSS